jgi:hypothetical protein
LGLRVIGGASKIKRLFWTSVMSTPAARKGFKPFLRYALVAGIVVGAAVAAVFGFIQSREQLTLEGERERPVKPPTRISAENGIPVITLDDKTQRTSGTD